MKMKREKILKVKKLSVKYGSNQKPIINDFTIEIEEREHLAIIGPSGCGKTTFAKTLVNMLPEKAISEGYISISGFDPRKIIKKKRNYLEELILDLYIKIR